VHDRVYDNTTKQIGVLGGTLPALIPRFYTRFPSELDDGAKRADGTYKGPPIWVLLRVHRDAQRILGETLVVGERVIGEIDARYR